MLGAGRCCAAQVVVLWRDGGAFCSSVQCAAVGHDHDHGHGHGHGRGRGRRVGGGMDARSAGPLTAL